ncbi:MAG: glycoside hydrolase family 9 protein [Vicinamibacteria bacterium]
MARTRAAPGRAGGGGRLAVRLATGIAAGLAIGPLAAVAFSASAQAVPREPGPPAIHLRANQAGYRPGDPKLVIAFSEAPLPGRFAVMDERGAEVLKAKARPLRGLRWGAFANHALIDLTALAKPGRYTLRPPGRSEGSAILVSETAGAGLADSLLEFVRQQRCGYNPFLDEVCHAKDGRTAYGPLPAGSYLDARGGWHDAGDQLKYLLTSSTATAHLLLAHELAPASFGDAHDALGRAGGNGLADVLDEAVWGLEWMLRLHPAAGQLYHQVADDRDHIGWKLPHEETSDYGWGKGGYRVVYFADGRPQGLKQYQSASDGIANLAGRYAAAMALGYGAFKDDPERRAFAGRCLRAGVEVYALGRAHEGVQQGNSYGAPYRYAETTWADDMEWGAAELHRATGETRYLDDALRYARLAGATSWMGREEIGHYEQYPFTNLGHFALHAAAGDARAELAEFYREGLEAIARKAASSPYGFGAPFIWCSNNLVVALATQALLYERISGDGAQRALAAAHVDWLLGRNPWGTSMFTGLPEGGTFPSDVHLSTTNLTKRPVRGGLVDGPVRRRIFEGLKGVALSRPDAFAAFQADEAVYHDDVGDYSTNEPTLDGTAAAILVFALRAAPPGRSTPR